MPLTAGEKIKVLLSRRGMTLKELAEKTSQSRQNISNKMARDNFSERELHEIAAALDCACHIEFVLNDTGESV